jgi:hypothetical protein
MTYKNIDVKYTNNLSLKYDVNKINILWANDYWDGILEGILEIKVKKYYFKLIIDKNDSEYLGK